MHYAIPQEAHYAVPLSLRTTTHGLQDKENHLYMGSMVAGSIVLKAKSLHLPKDAFSADFLINDLERSNLY